MKVINQTRGTTLIEDGEMANTFWTRLKGLIGHAPLKEGEGMVIVPCQSIHSFFMRFPIDAVFINGDNRVIRLAENLKPNRIGPIVPRAKVVVELPVGTIARTGTQVGDEIRLIEDSVA